VGHAVYLTAPYWKKRLLSKEGATDIKLVCSVKVALVLNNDVVSLRINQDLNIGFASS